MTITLEFDHFMKLDTSKVSHSSNFDPTIFILARLLMGLIASKLTYEYHAFYEFYIYENDHKCILSCFKLHINAYYLCLKGYFYV